MRLLIDAGNSALKWNLCAEDGMQLLRSTQVIFWRGIDLDACLDNEWRELKEVQAAWIANVASEALIRQLQQWLQQHWRIEPKVVRSQAVQLGVRNAYQDADALGVDRWLAMLAAHALFPAEDICIIDCGSAVTVDLLRGDGTHLGGMILPGPGLMQNSLRNNTRVFENLSLLEAEKNPYAILSQHDKNDEQLGADTQRDFGHNTLECINLGIAHSGIAFVEHIIRLTQRTMGREHRLIITGGDAPRLLPYLPPEVLYYPDLVLQGLSQVALEQR